MAVIVAAAGTVRGSVIFGTDTSVPLPNSDELRDNDLVILTMVGGWTGDPGSVMECDDPRMTTLYRSVGDAQGEHHLRIFAMTLGESRSPIQVTMRGSQGGLGLSHFFTLAHVVVLRDDSGARVGLDLTRRGGNNAGGLGLGVAMAPDMFNMPGEGPAALGIYVAYSGGIGGIYERQNWARVEPSWQLASSQDNSYLEIDYMLAQVRPVVPVTRTPYSGDGSLEGIPGDPALGGSIWTYGLIPLVKPATRQYPREDGTGHSSAPRLYPPPKSQRVIGGHQ